MKQLSTLLILGLLLFSCTKPDDNTVAQDGQFNITGVRDVDLSVTSTGSYSFPISVVSTSGTKDTVTLSGDFLPGGIYVSFSPRTGITPFTSQVTVYTDYTGSLGGIFPFQIKGVGRSGSRSYDIKATTAPFRGWKVGDNVYEPKSLIKQEGTIQDYALIRVLGDGSSQLVLSFAKGATLPTKNSTYKIAADSNTKDNINITFYEGTDVYRATGYNSNGVKGVTGTFTFDTLHRFIFRCSDVELSNGFKKQALNCNFSE